MALPTPALYGPPPLFAPFPEFMFVFDEKNLFVGVGVFIPYGGGVRGGVTPNSVVE